jgi:hypothetical protein
MTKGEAPEVWQFVLDKRLSSRLIIAAASFSALPWSNSWPGCELSIQPI